MEVKKQEKKKKSRQVAVESACVRGRRVEAEARRLGFHRCDARPPAATQRNLWHAWGGSPGT
jgi:hypothetical protein